MQDDPMTDRKTGAHLDEGRVHAWLDGELSAAESAAAERHVATCEQCAALVAEARGLIAASSRILSALDDDRSGVTPDADASVAAFAGVLARHRKGDDVEAPAAPNEHREGSEALGAAVPVEHGRQSAAAASGTVIPMQTRRRRGILHDPRWRVAATVLVLAGASALILTRGEVSSVMDSTFAESRSSEADATQGDAGSTGSSASGDAAPGGRPSPEAPPNDVGGAELERSVTIPPAEGASRRAEPSANMTPDVPAPPPLADVEPASPAPAPKFAAPQAAPLAAARRGDSVPAQDERQVAGMTVMESKTGQPSAGVTRVVRGQVRSMDAAQPVSGAVVHVPGAAASVATDDEGRFAIPVSPYDSLVVVRGLGYRPATVNLGTLGRTDSATVILERDVMAAREVAPGAVSQAEAALSVVLEAWLAEGAAPNDPRVLSSAGCWALVGGRVPGASEGVLLRLHGATGGSGRSWVPLGSDSLLVRLAGSSELRLERSGDRLAGFTRRSAIAGTASVAIEFARVTCRDDE